jgi:4-amino-4-deoxy-L-arabinose transferase-like glycosyltransferase
MFRFKFDPLPTCIVAALLFLYCFGLLDHDLWTPDEPRVASIARQVAQGAWVIPTLNGEPFLEEPPFHVWCVALAFRWFGYDPPGVGRIVSALFALGGLVFTYLLARELAGRQSGKGIGLLATLALALCAEYFAAAHRVVPDAALTFFTTGSAFACVRGLRLESSEAAVFWLTLGYAFASLAFLSKGLIGLAVPGLAFLSVIAARRQLRQPALALNSWERTLPACFLHRHIGTQDASAPRLQVLLRARLWLAPVVFSAIAGPWLYLLDRKLGPQGLRLIFIDNTLWRILPSTGYVGGHTQPFYYYVVQFVPLLWPAALFVVGGILYRFSPKNELDSAEQFACDVALLWLFSGMLMLSLAATKRSIYLLPLLPAAAVVGGFWLDAFLRKQVDGFYDRAAGYILAATLGVAAAAPLVLLLASIFKLLPEGALASVCSGFALPAVSLMAAIGVTFAVAVAVAAKRDKRKALLSVWLVGLVVTLLLASHTVTPVIDREKSFGPVCRTIGRLVPPAKSIYLWKPDETTRAMIPFYTGRTAIAVQSKGQLRDYLAQEREVYLVDVEKNMWGDLEIIMAFAPKVLVEDVRPGSRSIWLLYLNRIPAG